MKFAQQFKKRLASYQKALENSSLYALASSIVDNSRPVALLYSLYALTVCAAAPALSTIVPLTDIVVLWLVSVPLASIILPNTLVVLAELVTPPIALFAESGIYLFTDTYTAAEKYIKQNKKAFIALTNEEISQAEHINELRDDLALYHTLLEKFSKLDEALTKRNNTQEDLDDNLIMDDLAIMPIKDPIIIFKEYKDEAGKWNALPHTLKITCVESIHKQLKPWQHPGTREDMQSALLTHKNSATQQLYSARYTVYNYEHGMRPHVLRELQEFIAKQVKAQTNNQQQAANNHDLFDGNNHSNGRGFFSQLSSNNTKDDLSLDINLSFK